MTLRLFHGHCSAPSGPAHSKSASLVTRSRLRHRRVMLATPHARVLVRRHGSCRIWDITATNGPEPRTCPAYRCPTRRPRRRAPCGRPVADLVGDRGDHAHGAAAGAGARAAGGHLSPDAGIVAALLGRGLRRRGQLSRSAWRPNSCGCVRRRCPTGPSRGDEPGEDYRRWLSGVLPRAELEVWPCRGHYPHLADPIRFAGVLLATENWPADDGHGRASADIPRPTDAADPTREDRRAER